jgi:hypothetical protein
VLNPFRDETKSQWTNQPTKQVTQREDLRHHLFLFSVILSYGTQSLNVQRSKFKTAPVHAMEAWGAMDVQFHFLTSAQDGGECSTSRPGV